MHMNGVVRQKDNGNEEQHKAEKQRNEQTEKMNVELSSSDSMVEGECIGLHASCRRHQS